MRLPVLTLMLLAASSSVVVACGAGVPEQRSPGPGRASVGELPTSYRYVLRASCGERQLAGRYRVVVRHGTVVAVRPGADPRRTGLGLGEFPTLADLVDKAEHSEPEAVVDLRVDASGVPTYLSIDHVPDAIDDEECYRVTGLHLLSD